MHGHAREIYLVVAEGRENVHVFNRSGFVATFARGDEKLRGLVAGSGSPTEFDRLFREEACDEEYAQALLDLGAAMMAPRDSSMTVAFSNIPAGYTYLGQFLAHDITWTRISADDGLQNLRTPSLDLDSLWPSTMGPGGGPTASAECGGDGAVRIGCTASTLYYPSYAADLPRGSDGVAEIVDERNDDVLPLAQVHHLVLRFINRVATRPSRPAGEPDSELHRIVAQHLQSIVIHDYLRRLVQTDVHDDVMNNGRRKYLPSRGGVPVDDFRLPIEFAAAVFRFGHAMIRSHYPAWNRANPAGLLQFWHFTRNSRHPAHADGDMLQLPSDWVTNWLRLFDVSGTAFPGEQCEVLMAAAIDTRLAEELGRFPEHALRTPSPTGNLAQITLSRSCGLRLACAQTAIAELNAALPAQSQIVPLTPAQLKDREPSAVVDVLQRHDGLLLRRTPLWFYVLKEAQSCGGGNRLGPFASRVVMETLHAVIEHSPHSILADSSWQPELPSVATDHFTMADLLVFTGGLNLLGAC